MKTMLRSMLFASSFLVPVLVFILTEPRCIIGGCEGVTTIDVNYTQNSGTIYSPGYPNNYSNNLVCSWLIKALPGQKVAINIKELDIEYGSQCRHDSLNLYDGPSYSAPLLTKICGENYDAPRQGMYYSSGRYMYIRFISDQYESGKGFVADYEAENVTSDSRCNRFIQIFDTTYNQNGTLYIPGFFNNYSHKKWCAWIIKAPRGQKVLIYFTEFDIPCEGDIVRIFSGVRWSTYPLSTSCGNSLPRPVYSYGRYMYLYLSFTSDGSDSGKGFVAHYRPVNRTYTLGECDGSTQTIDLRYSQNGEISSPVYPYYSYYHLENCSWLIQGSPGQKVFIHFTEFDIQDCSQCRDDSVSIYDGFDIFAPRLSKSCGSSLPPSFFSSSRYMYMTFTSDMFGSSKGFKAHYQAINARSGSGCSGSTAFIDLSFAQNGTIYSPGYPNNYGNNMDCSWLIKAPPGQKVLIYFSDFDIEDRPWSCSHDGVRIFDGPGDFAPRLLEKCGRRESLPAPVYSSGEYMYMTFTSDLFDTAKGFVAHCRALNSSSGCPQIVPGASVGVIYSPNFPWSYPKGISCDWQFTVPWQRFMELKFASFDLKPNSSWSGDCDDYVLVEVQNSHRTWKYCGSQIPKSLTFNLNKREENITVRFYSNYSGDAYKGFMAVYDLTGRSWLEPTKYPYPRYTCEPEYQADVVLESTGSATISSISRNIGDNYTTKHCKFRIYSKKGYYLELRFKTMNISGGPICSRGYVKVRDGSYELIGTYCSGADYQHVVTTKRHVMFVEFYGYKEDKFTATISSKEIKGDSTVVTAVIRSLLGVVVIGLLVLFYYCNKRKSSYQIQPRCTELQLTSSVPAGTEGSYLQLSSDSPPAYSSVMANEPPPYISVVATTSPSTSSASTVPSRPTNT